MPIGTDSFEVKCNPLTAATLTSYQALGWLAWGRSPFPEPRVHLDQLSGLRTLWPPTHRGELGVNVLSGGEFRLGEPISLV